MAPAARKSSIAGLRLPSDHVSPAGMTAIFAPRAAIEAALATASEIAQTGM